ncbi:FIST signal transduction protein [Nitrosomonas supralitoralis]|uniref:FIST domain protein n=1 Tax=Nitrosomonas supralitoralis TaxID=2116706 RepID=A0A2P7NQV5_9PROT|nr:FIST N-terminal domain-containing protein [Nitrosomonas supralitoralis]PSJ15866.1 FIST domain protein [Nitrosomonas supralitoralis]
MTDVAVSQTNLPDSKEAGIFIGQELKSKLNQKNPDVVILFASPKYDYNTLLKSVEVTCNPEFLVGCSSAGEFTSSTPQISTVCAMALSSNDMLFNATLGKGLRADRGAVAHELAGAFKGPHNRDYAYRSAMILTDALAGYADNLIEQITVQTAGTYQLFGGGAGDDAKFQRTHVFYGTEAFPDAAVALEILSNKPIGIGVHHGWEPAGPQMRVTESQGAKLISLNAAPAIEAFLEHAKSTGQIFKKEDPLPFFLSNVLGILTRDNYRLRVPLTINEDGSINCAADILVGSSICIMKATERSATKAAEMATKSALAQLNNHKPKAAFFFDCVATRLRTGQDFGLELTALQDTLLPAQFVGCNTYGQIARAEGQFGGFHNCTAVIGIIPD